MEKLGVNIVLIGGVGSGKSSLWQAYFKNKKLSNHAETIFDNYTTTVEYNGTEVPISLFEVSGEEHYFQLRQIMYSLANVVIFCVPIDSPENVKHSGAPGIDTWAQEVKAYCKGVPILVVGTKTDLREDHQILKQLGDKKLKPLKLRDIASCSKKFKNSFPIECSAVSKEGLHSVFHTAVKMGLRNKSAKKK